MTKTDFVELVGEELFYDFELQSEDEKAYRYQIGLEICYT